MYLLYLRAIYAVDCRSGFQPQAAHRRPRADCWLQGRLPIDTAIGDKSTFLAEGGCFFWRMEAAHWWGCTQWHLRGHLAACRRWPIPEPVEGFLIEKLVDLEVARGSATFLAAVVLDPWAYTAGGFGKWGWKKIVLVGVVAAILVDFGGLQKLRIRLDFGGWQMRQFPVTLPLADFS